MSIPSGHPTAHFDLGLVLGDDEPQGRQVVDLSFSHAIGFLIHQRTVAALAHFHMVDFCVIGLCGHLERMARMSGLSAGLSLPFLAQAFRGGFLEAIA